LVVSTRPSGAPSRDHHRGGWPTRGRARAPRPTTSSTLPAPTAIHTRATPSSTTSYASSTRRATWRSSSTTAPSCCSRPTARRW